MNELLVTIILAICPASFDGSTNECMEQINNCAVELKTLVTAKSIKKCVEEYEQGE